MTSDENTAKALARWLDQPPGTEPPSELGRDVVEAVYALRPDLAPVPRLTADDILADVRRGPLATFTASPTSTGSREGAEVVAFPGERADASESDPGFAARPGRRMWWWVGGTGGVGLALVAAATLALVALPGLKPDQEEASVLAASPDAAETPATRPAAELQTEADLLAPIDAARSAPASPRAAAGGGRASFELEAKLGTRGPAEPRADDAASPPSRSAEEMAGLGSVGGGGNNVAPPAPIAEVAASASESNTGAVAQEAVPQEAEKAQAKPKLAVADAAPVGNRVDGLPSGEGLDEETRDKIDETVVRAERVRKKDRQAANEILSEVIAPPAVSGQYAATVAAERALDDGDPDAALEIARQGLALSDLETPERARLEEIESEALAQQVQAGQPK